MSILRFIDLEEKASEAYRESSCFGKETGDGT
jgi:hypothetical protein